MGSRNPIVKCALLTLLLINVFFLSIAQTSENHDCVWKDDSGKRHIRASCVNLEKGITHSLKLEDLGVTAVAQFECNVSAVTGEQEIESRRFEDQQDITSTFLRPLLSANIPLVERNPKNISRLLNENKFSSSGLINMKTAPSLGRLLGAKTLIIGEFYLQGEFKDARQDSAGNLILSHPKAIQTQSIRIRGLDLEQGKIVFDIKASLHDKVAGYPLPRPLAAFVGKQLVEDLTKGSKDKP